MIAPTLVALLAAGVASAFVLVFVLRWDERLDPTVDREYHWLYPGVDRAQSVVKLTLRHTLLAALLAIASLYLWDAIAPRLGAAPRPVPLQDVAPAALLRYALLHEVALVWVAAIFLATALRCLGTPLYDLFLSYKSEDVVLARQIADALTAAGHRVWFAEYRVLLVRRERFQAAILLGIASSRYGLVLTNDRWARSEHCGLEIRALLKVLEPAKILEIRIPSEPLPHRAHPALAACPALASNDLSAILAFVGRTTGLSTPAALPAVPPDGARWEALAGGRPCSLLVEGWTLHEPGGATDGSLNGQTFRYDGLPEGRLFVNVHSGPETSREGQRFDQGIDDRRMFDQLVEWAPRHVERVEARVRGVHLLFHSGLSQMALTYWARRRTLDGPQGRMRVGGFWVRKVSLVIPNPVTEQSAEFVFTFGFNGPFAEYCRHARVMDALALSLRWS